MEVVGKGEWPWSERGDHLWLYLMPRVCVCIVIGGQIVQCQAHPTHRAPKPALLRVETTPSPVSPPQP